MDAIVNFFDSIGSLVFSTIELLWNFLIDLLTIVQLLSKFLSQIPSFFNWLPSSITALLISIFAVVVLYKIAGREG